MVVRGPASAAPRVTSPVTGQHYRGGMSEPFFSATRIVPPRTQAQGEPLWECHRNHVRWSGELRDHGPHGVEAQILRDGELVEGRRFSARNPAIAWSELFRERLERALA